MKRLISAAAWFFLKVGTRAIRLSTFLTSSLFGGSAAPNQSGLPDGRRVWIDVGAHRGETTFDKAQRDPSIMVYAFEPDASVAVHRYGVLENFVMIPMAVSDCDGFHDFCINSNNYTSSLLPLNPLGNWRGAPNLRTEKRVLVPIIRLDTFLNSLGISEVDYMKIDAQGHDMEVIKSLGNRLRDVRELNVEALTASDSLYQGAHNRAGEIVTYLQERGFRLVQSSSQSLDQETNLLFRRKDEKAMPNCAQSSKVGSC